MNRCMQAEWIYIDSYNNFSDYDFDPQNQVNLSGTNEDAEFTDLYETDEEDPKEIEININNIDDSDDDVGYYEINVDYIAEDEEAVQVYPDSIIQRHDQMELDLESNMEEENESNSELHPITYDFDNDENNLDQSTLCSLKLHALATKHSVSQEYQDKQMKLLNKFHASSDRILLKLPYLAKKELYKLYSIVPKTYNCYINSYMMYEEDNHSESYQICSEQQYQESRKWGRHDENFPRVPKAIVSQLPLSSQLAQLISTDNT
ncbi:hypothetical protein EC973_006541 [Apophysomyces ossiformis]|uniref:Uncharacterized protein n=1 Tax=Apophysomyces ossiformis TaxID=679940 RepID=A0A8H7EKQ2_9FUNG|nr:hypothetical protein EC973_006541 [Apophysomyces ossiformis]